MTAPRWPRCAAAGVGFLWFLHLGGWAALDPTNIGWLQRGDWSQHLLGWLLFRNEPWRFPLGTLSGALYPVGTTIGFMDANPLVALPLKLISPLLPANFSFIGPWLAVCFVLQGYMGARLASLFTRVPVQQWLAGSLFALSPALSARIAHDTLCAHWLILAVLYLGLRPHADGRSARRAIAQSVGLMLMAAALHPYLAVMLWPLTLAVALTALCGRQVSWRAVAVTTGVATGGLLAVFGVVGYLSIGGAQVAAGGFGSFSADLLTLINSMGKSRVLEGWPLKSEQSEGFGYLGLGGLLACGLAVRMMVRERAIPVQRAWPIVGVCGLLALYALSSIITIRGLVVLNLTSLYRPIESTVQAFRSSGRFIWPLHYLALCAGVWGCLRIARGRQLAATVILGVVLVLQAIDLRGFQTLGEPFTLRPISAPGWPLAIGRYHHLALVPMQVNEERGPVPRDDVTRLMLQAYRLHMTINSGIYARFDAVKVKAACRQIEQDADRGTLDPDTIYVVAAPFLERFRRAGASCGVLDGDWICVAATSDALFRAHLAQHDPGASP